MKKAVSLVKQRMLRVAVAVLRRCLPRQALEGVRKIVIVRKTDRVSDLGDGITDVPCMKLTKENGGHSIGIYNTDPQVAERLLEFHRVDCIVPADYREGSLMEQTVFCMIDELAKQIEEEEHE